jgi:hypothetical protein
MRLRLEENWLLRVVLDWFGTHDAGDHPLAFAPNARWFSEAGLPSAFLTRPFPESWTHADGVIGHFRKAAGSSAGMRLWKRDAAQIVREASAEVLQIGTFEVEAPQCFA